MHDGFRKRGAALLLTALTCASGAVLGQADPFIFQGALLVEPAPMPERTTPARDGARAMGNRGGAAGAAAMGMAMGAAGMGAAPENSAAGGGRRAAKCAAAAAVQLVLPAQRRSPVALILIPGGGLSSWSYASTPDGRDGWAQLFARAGIPAYLVSPPSGRRQQAGRWNQESVWPLWGIGPEFGVPYPNSQFPVAAIGQLQASFRIAPASACATHLLGLLQQIGPAMILAHSAGGGPMFSAARANPPNLRGAIAVETTNCPRNEQELKRIFVDGDRAFLSLWGDHLDRGQPSMLARYESCRSASERIAKLGGRAETLRLPEDRGISGNTHLMMQDANSAEIAAILIDWVRANADAKRQA